MPARFAAPRRAYDVELAFDFQHHQAALFAHTRANLSRAEPSRAAKQLRQDQPPKGDFSARRPHYHPVALQSVFQLYSNEETR